MHRKCTVQCLIHGKYAIKTTANITESLLSVPAIPGRGWEPRVPRQFIRKIWEETVHSGVYRAQRASGGHQWG